MIFDTLLSRLRAQLRQPSFIAQALKADAEAKEGVLERDAATQQCLQAELDRVKKVYEHERELVKTHQEDKASWMSKAKIKEQVCTGQPQVYIFSLSLVKAACCICNLSGIEQIVGDDNTLWEWGTTYCPMISLQSSLWRLLQCSESDSLR